MRLITYWIVDYYKKYDNCNEKYICKLTVVAKTKERAEITAHQYLVTDPLYIGIAGGEWTRKEQTVVIDEQLPYTIRELDEVMRIA